jgi:streptogramin lyase
MQQLSPNILSLQLVAIPKVSQQALTATSGLQKVVPARSDGSHQPALTTSFHLGGARTRQFSVTWSSEPQGITAGPDGNIWFTEKSGNRIGRITPTGTVTEFAVPTAHGYPDDITTGPDGNLWFTEGNVNKIGRITPTGTITEFTLPSAYGDPYGIIAGPDGNIWFTKRNAKKIGRITPTGTITEFSIPEVDSSRPEAITAGPDGNLWFTKSGPSKIGRITTAGTITEFVVPTADSAPWVITAGPDGNVWFTETFGNKIGRITPTGTITEFTLPSTGSLPAGITAGPDGNIWFAEYGVNKIGELSGIDGPLFTLRLMHGGNPVNTYSTFHDAYAAAVDGDIIQTQALDLTGPLTFTDTDVTLSGGYNAAFVLNLFMTIITDNITIGGSGTVTVENLIIN